MSTFVPRNGTKEWYTELCRFEDKDAADDYVIQQMKVMESESTDFDKTLEMRQQELYLREAHSLRVHTLTTKTRITALKGTESNEEDTLLKLKLRAETEKAHKYKTKMRSYRSREDIAKEEELAKHIKIQYKTAINNATLTQILVEGSKRQQLMVAQDLVMSNFDQIVQDNNLRYVCDLSERDEGQAQLFGDRIVACPYPMLWKEVEDAVSANNVMLSAMKDWQIGEPLSGGEPKPTMVNRARLEKYFKQEFKANIKPNVFEAAKANGKLLSGSGYKVYVGEDGSVVLDDLEAAFGALNATVTALQTQLQEAKETIKQLQGQQGYLYQQQQLIQQPQHQQRAASPARATCYACGKVGHIARNCWSNGNGGANTRNNNNNNNNNTTSNKRSSSNASNRGKN